MMSSEVLRNRARTFHTMAQMVGAANDNELYNSLVRVAVEYDRLADIITKRGRNINALSGRT